MVQMVCRAHAVLLCARETELAASADPACEPDAHQTADLQTCAVCDVWAEGEDSPDPFVPADVGEFDFCYGGAVGAGCCAGFCV